MYLPPQFAQTDPDSLVQCLREHPLATLVTVGADGLVADHIPMLWRASPSGALDEGALWGHVARANPVWQRAASQQVLAIFQGPQAYISPNWYATKHPEGRVVPTWNYVVVHARGELVVRDDPEWVLNQMALLTDVHEADQPRPWRTDEAPADHLARLSQAVVGIELRGLSITGKWKVSQNQPPANQHGVIAGLRTGTPAGERQHQAAMADLVASFQAPPSPSSHQR